MTVLTQESNGPLVVKGEIKVDGKKYPHLRRALERGQELTARNGRAAVVNPTIGNTEKTEETMATKTAVKKLKASKAGFKAKKATAKKGERDPRIPAPGGVIERKYKGQVLKVKVLAQGFEFEGETFSSLTALALKVTGAKAISGPRFFNITEPKPVEAKA